LDQEKKHPYVQLRNHFIKSDETPEEFAINRGLSESALEIIKTERWVALRDTLRSQHEDVYKTVAAYYVDSSLKYEIELYELKAAQLMDEVNYFRRYKEKYGDLFKRNAEGDLVLDHYGRPLTHDIPSGLADRSAHIMEYLENLGKIDNVHRRLRGEIIEIDASTSTVDPLAGLLESRKI
jgi:hypothetical protein